MSQVFHDAENGFGGFTFLIYNARPQGPIALRRSLRRDYYQIPYDPNPNDFENQQFHTSGLRDGQHETDGFAVFSWVHTFNPNVVLTISPFYHYNSANYRGSAERHARVTTDDRSSNYGGGQAVLGYHAAEKQHAGRHLYVRQQGK